MKHHAACQPCPKCDGMMSHGSTTCAKCAGKGRKGHAGQIVTHTCEQCGEDFQLPLWRSNQGRGRFCCRACVNAYQATIRGKDHCKFQGGRLVSYYTGANWLRARKAVMERAGGRCERCDEPLRRNGYVVHHSIGVYDFPEPDDGHTVDNMSAICKSCHAKHHGLGRIPKKGGDAHV